MTLEKPRGFDRFSLSQYPVFPRYAKIRVLSGIRSVLVNLARYWPSGQSWISTQYDHDVFRFLNWQIRLEGTIFLCECSGDETYFFYLVETFYTERKRRQTSTTWKLCTPYHPPCDPNKWVHVCKIVRLGTCVYFKTCRLDQDNEIIDCSAITVHKYDRVVCCNLSCS